MAGTGPPVASPPVGSRGDACDCALAEAVIGLCKTGLVCSGSPRSALGAIALATLEWV